MWWTAVPRTAEQRRLWRACWPHYNLVSETVERNYGQVRRRGLGVAPRGGLLFAALEHGEKSLVPTDYGDNPPEIPLL